MKKNLIAFFAVILLLVFVGCSVTRQNASETTKTEPAVTTASAPVSSTSESVEPDTGIQTASDQTPIPSSDPTSYSIPENTETYYIQPLTDPKTPSTPDEDPTVSEQTTDEPTKTPAPGSLNILDVLKSLNVSSVLNKSVVCYSKEVGVDGGQTIEVVINRFDRKSADKTVYTFYAEESRYEAAIANLADVETELKEKHLVITSKDVVDAITNPDEYISIALFGFKKI